MKDEKNVVVRKNARDLTNKEKKKLVKAILELKTDGKYDKYVTRHANAPFSKIHQCPAFLPWHRQFILEFEKDLQKAAGDPKLGLPYWNSLEDGADSPIWGPDLLGGDGDSEDDNIVKTGPFRKGEWTIVNRAGAKDGALKRQFGRRSLPTQAVYDDVMAATPYDKAPWNSDRRGNSSSAFRFKLEGLHNSGHMWVGHSMGVMTSPNDPVFFMHHCFIDKIWADWQAKYPDQGYLPVQGGSTGQNLNDKMEATVYNEVTPAEVLDISKLGYYYSDPGKYKVLSGGAATWKNTAAMTSLEFTKKLYIVQNNNLYRVKPEDGSYENISTSPGAWQNTAAMTALESTEMLYIVQNDNLHLVNPATGESKNISTSPGTWRKTTAMTALESESMEMLFIVQNDNLYRVDPSDGTYTNISTSPGTWHHTTAMTTLGNMLYIVQNGRLYRVNPEDGSYTDISRPDRTWFNTTAMTALKSSGMLYIAQNDNLYIVNPMNGSYRYISTKGATWWETPAMTSLEYGSKPGKGYAVQGGHLYQFET